MNVEKVKMDKKNKVLLIGVDTTKLQGTNVTEFDSTAIRKEAELALQNLIDDGYDAKWHFLDLTGTPLENLTKELEDNSQFDCILIGAGIRRRPETLGLFESIINIVHQHAPHSKISLNADVLDTVDAVKRHLKL